MLCLLGLQRRLWCRDAEVMDRGGGFPKHGLLNWCLLDVGKRRVFTIGVIVVIRVLLLLYLLAVLLL